MKKIILKLKPNSISGVVLQKIRNVGKWLATRYGYTYWNATFSTYLHEVEITLNNGNTGTNYKDFA